MEIAPDVHRIGPTRNGYRRGGYSQAYLFIDGDSLVLVDTGYDSDAHEILQYLWSLGYTPLDLTDIAITHAHRSHLGGLATLKRLNPGVKVHAHAWEADIIAGTRASQPIPLKPLFPLQLYPLRILQLFNRPKHDPCPVKYLIGEDDQIGPLRVLFTPGHTPGCLSFYWPEREVLAVGDAVATWPRFDAGWPGFNLDEGRYQKSLQRLVELAPKVVCPGHGPAVTENTAERLEALLKGPYWPGPSS